MRVSVFGSLLLNDSSVDLAPPLDPADPQFYPVVRVECERTGSFYNPNGGGKPHCKLRTSVDASDHTIRTGV